MSSDSDTSIVTQLNSMSPVTLTSGDGQDMGQWTRTLQQHIQDQGGSQQYRGHSSTEVTAVQGSQQYRGHSSTGVTAAVQGSQQQYRGHSSSTGVTAAVQGSQQQYRGHSSNTGVRRTRWNTQFCAVCRLCFTHLMVLHVRNVCGICPFSISS